MEIQNDELKTAKKRYGEAMKMVGELEDRISGVTRQYDEQKRANDKLNKEI